jgi:hypothetical protein
LLVLVQDFILYQGQWMIYRYKGSTETDIASVCLCGSPKENGTASRYMLGLAERVAQSGEVLNVAECLEVEKGSGGNIKSLLAMPIRNRHYQIIGKFIDMFLTSVQPLTAAVVQTILSWVIIQCKGEVHPRTGREGPEGE